MIFIHTGYGYPQKLFAEGRTNYTKFYLKILRLADFLIFKSSLFRSDKPEGKKEFNYKYSIAVPGIVNYLNQALS